MRKTVVSLRPGLPVGIFLVLAVAAVTALAVQKFLPSYLLTRDAQDTAMRIVALQSDAAQPAILATPDRSVSSAILYEANLDVAALGGGSTAAGAAQLARDPRFVLVAQNTLLKRRPGFLHDVSRGEGGEDGTFITRVFLPVGQPGGAGRLLVADIDQTNLAALLQRALGIGMLLLFGVSAAGTIIPAVIAMRRAAQRKATDEHIRFLALHDPLTGLPNRVQLKEHLGLALSRAKRRNGQVGMLALDLDRFKEVNDTLGHAAGDALLISVADRLRASLRDSDLVARLGGDEFAIVIEDPSALNDIASLARRLCCELAKPHKVNGHNFCTSTSIGIAVGPLDGTNTDALQRNADLALYRAKAQGRNSFTFFEPAMDNALKERSLLEHDLRQALAENQLSLAYQPQFNLQSGTLCGYEALVRWEHPSRGAISPDTFIPLAEESGVIHMIAEWVLETACRDATTWPLGTMLAVNLSPAQFKTGDITSMVAHILGKSGLDAKRLDLEIPEALLFDNKDETLARLRKLRQMGVTITIDDFGTGFSSLSHLSRFPFDKIKIDRSFVAGLRRETGSSPIIDAIVGIGESLGVAVAAEGIETQFQADALREAGCTQVQGFLYGEPGNRVVSREMALHKASLVRRTSSAA